MTINAWENNTKVLCPDGHEGRLRVTRRERQLISDGKLTKVDVKGTDGLTRTFTLSELVEVIKDETPDRMELLEKVAEAAEEFKKELIYAGEKDDPSYDYVENFFEALDQLEEHG